MRTCDWCEKPLSGVQRRFCSSKCSSNYHYAHRHEKPENIAKPKLALENCEVCGKLLTGRQERFCSRDCKNAIHQSYPNQKRRGLERKLEFVQRLGGKCARCGYSKNLAALSFHHKDEDKKEHELDMRSLSNHTLEVVLQEFEKCELLCANCHMELHYPYFDMDKIDLARI